MPLIAGFIDEALDDTMFRSRGIGALLWIVLDSRC
jgi:hypothetical protein